MYKSKYHIVLGVVSLAISIVLPTLIHHYYYLLKPWNEALFHGDPLIAFSAYGLLLLLMFFLCVFLVIALRELGGYMIGIMDNNEFEVKENYP